MKVQHAPPGELPDRKGVTKREVQQRSVLLVLAETHEEDATIDALANIAQHVAEHGTQDETGAYAEFVRSWASNLPNVAPPTIEVWKILVRRPTLIVP